MIELVKVIWEPLPDAPCLIARDLDEQVYGCAIWHDDMWHYAYPSVDAYELAVGFGLPCLGRSHEVHVAQVNWRCIRGFRSFRCMPGVPEEDTVWTWIPRPCESVLPLGAEFWTTCPDAKPQQDCECADCVSARVSGVAPRAPGRLVVLHPVTGEEIEMPASATIFRRTEVNYAEKE